MQRSLFRVALRFACVAGTGVCTACTSLGPVDPFETLQRSTLFVGTDTAPAGALELEVGTLLDPNDSHAIVATATYGWTERTELFAEAVPYARVERPGPDAHGFGDLVLGATSRFREDTADGPALALRARVKLPVGTSDADLSSGATDFALGLVAADVRGPGVLSATLDFEALGEDGPNGAGVDFAASAGLHVARTLRERLVAFTSLSASVVPERDARQGTLLLGLAFALSRSAVLDLGLSGGLGDDAGLALSWGVILALP